MPNPTCSPGASTQTTATLNGSVDALPANQSVRISWGTSPVGPFPNATASEAGTGATPQPIVRGISGLTPNTAYYFRTEELDTDGVTVIGFSSTCVVVTASAPTASPAFVPTPCATCGEESSGGTPQTLSAQHRLVGDTDAAWTPGTDVVGTLVSVTYTVLTGTATVTDADGTVAAGLPAGLSATWGVDDADALTGPSSIDAVGGQTYVNWLQR